MEGTPECDIFNNFAIKVTVYNKSVRKYYLKLIQQLLQ